MAIDKIFKSSNVDDLADNILSEVDDFMVSVDKMQQRKVAGNVQKVIQAFKQIETDLQDRYDNVTDVLEKRVSTIKDGRDGLNGTDGRSGRDGKPGRDGVNGKQGTPGTPGKDGADGLDGVSVTNANIDFDGSLVISLSSGQQINVGEVVPPELERQLVELRQGGGSAGSSGDVMGPTSSTDNAIVRFDGTTGKVVQNSEVTIDDTGNTNFAQTPVLYSGDGTVKSGRLLGRYSYRTATPTTAYFYDFNNSNTITSADSLSATKLATLIDSTITNANALTAFGTSYGTKAAGVSFVSGTASDVLLASVGSAPLLNTDINAVVVGYTSVGPRIAIQNYALNDDTANAISYVGAVHRFYPAGTEVAAITSTGLAVTGTLSATGTLSGGTSGTGYSFSGSAPATSLTLTSGGNLGVGTTTPDANLTVNGAASFAAGTALLPSITRAGDLNTGMWFPAADIIAFSEGGVEAMRIDASRRLLVGTTTAPSVANVIVAPSGYLSREVDLTLNGTSTVTVPTGCICTIASGGFPGDSAIFSIKSTGGSQGVYVLAQGTALNIGFGTTTNPSTGTRLNMWISATNTMSIQDVGQGARTVRLTFTSIS